MMSDANVACADMTLADAIQDLASRTGIPKETVRTMILQSGAYDCLYDEATGLWASGPDAFIDFFEELSHTRQRSAGDAT